MSDSLRYPIAVSVAMGKDRRIRLPKCLRRPMHYVLVENAQAGQLWLGICGLDLLVQLRSECENLRVVAEYRTSRPTIPEAVCNRHGFSANVAIWLMTTGKWIEICSDLSWQAEISCALCREM